VSAETGNFFDHATVRVGHEIPVALVPQLVAVRKRPGDPTTVGFNGVFGHEFRVERRQIAMPVDD
jgi:hypothetical protein